MLDVAAPYFTFWSLGAAFTLGLSVAVFPVAVFLGLGSALAYHSRRRGAAGAARIYFAVFRGLPEILVILAAFHGINIVLREAGESVGIVLPTIDPFLAAWLALAVQFGAYAGVILSDWLRIQPVGLSEAGAAIGMTTTQIRRRIVIPLALRGATASLGNLFLVLLKISALASLIGVEELSRRTAIVSGAIRDPLLAYSVAAVLYLMISALAEVGQNLLERRSRRRGGAGA
jgi:ABC-type arginine transport system permease subunit